ncbi:hypothetical protein ABZ079_35850 [Streptomyces sp. NPDC006314]|uniref:hypothetical protein n=1 Tax=Streptomyces sp. NPDC006314 TaxID=3154475 RepID=UPI0033A93877
MAGRLTLPALWPYVADPLRDGSGAVGDGAGPAGRWRGRREARKKASRAAPAPIATTAG